MAGVRPFIDEIPDFEIRDGIVHINCGEVRLAMPLSVFHAAYLAAGETLAKWQVAQIAKRDPIVPMKRRKKR